MSRRSGPALGAGHHRHVGGLVELEQPARLVRLARIGGGAIDGVGRQARKLRLLGDAARVGAAGVEHVLGEFGCQLRQALRDLAIAGLSARRQIDAGEAKIAQCILHHLALRQDRVPPSCCST
jgi:hypothetical protein